MTVSFEYLQYTLNEWAENIAVKLGEADQSKLNKNDQKDALRGKFMAALEKGEPQGIKKMSERSFVLLCFGMSYGSIVAPKMMDKLSGSRPMDAWRASVHKNRYQMRYDVFESVLKEGIDRLGIRAVLAELPQHGSAKISDVADALASVGFQSTYFKQGEVAQMIRNAPPVGGAGASVRKSGPAA